MKEIIIIKENIPRIKTFLEKEHINYEICNIPEGQIYQEPTRKFKKARPAKVDIFSDYGEALKDKELEAEKRLLKKWTTKNERTNNSYCNNGFLFCRNHVAK